MIHVDWPTAVMVASISVSAAFTVWALTRCN